MINRLELSIEPNYLSIEHTYLYFPILFTSLPISQSLSLLSHMGNPVYFFLLTDIAYLSGYVFKGID